jgi:hypothetical protein
VSRRDAEWEEARARRQQWDNWDAAGLSTGLTGPPSPIPESFLVTQIADLNGLTPADVQTVLDQAAQGFHDHLPGRTR